MNRDELAQVDIQSATEQEGLPEPSKHAPPAPRAQESAKTKKKTGDEDDHL
jgi:hypothetical protein